jgi:hypothetical protein
MKLYNYELEGFISFLYRLKLVDYHSRMRTRFIKLLDERLNQYKDEYFGLVKEYSNLDDNGDPKIIKEENIERYDIKDPKAFKKAVEELLMEEVIIDETEERKKMLLSVRDSILNCGIEFEGDEALIYDRWCEVIENVYGGEKYQ